MCQSNEINEKWLNCFLRTYFDAKNANSNFLILNKLYRKIKSINITKQSMPFAKIRSFWLIDCLFDLTSMCFLVWFIICFFSWSINTFRRNRAICRQIIVANSLKIHHCNKFIKKYVVVTNSFIKNTIIVANSLKIIDTCCIDLIFNTFFRILLISSFWFFLSRFRFSSI